MEITEKIQMLQKLGVRGFDDELVIAKLRKDKSIEAYEKISDFVGHYKKSWTEKPKSFQALQDHIEDFTGIKTLDNYHVVLLGLALAGCRVEATIIEPIPTIYPPNEKGAANVSH